jgi:hypothetical protein
LLEFSNGLASCAEEHVPISGTKYPHVAIFFNFPLCCTVGQLGKGQAQQLIERREADDFPVAEASLDEFSELRQWQKIHDLRKKTPPAFLGHSSPSEFTIITNYVRIDYGIKKINALYIEHIRKLS